MKTYRYLLSLSPHKRKSLRITGIILIILLIITLNINTYDSYITYGLYNGTTLNVDVPISNSDNIKNGIYAKVDNQKIYYSVDAISNLKVEDTVNYETINLKIDKKLKENEIVKITFYSNKERIIKKIIKLIF